MSERITIEQAVSLTGFSEEEIRDWATSKQIRSYSIRGGEPLIDVVSLQTFAGSTKISPLLKIIIAELASFIEDKKARLIFTQITGGAKILDKLHIETMEDMLRYIETMGLKSLLKVPGFGKCALEELRFQLEKHRIIDKNEYSDLYQYIVRD